MLGCCSLSSGNLTTIIGEGLLGFLCRFLSHFSSSPVVPQPDAQHERQDEPQAG
ncbi:hypothetical protein ST21_007 [Aeromonas phage ST21]|uniref:Uncharacterized protein n=1 Tax=Aeromonas phage ST21 TaxID=3065691 RepID=A0AA96EVI6_9CAUD|nr:hypothetical protein ST21_007 [Aeromonas phage ST21]